MQGKVKNVEVNFGVESLNLYLDKIKSLIKYGTNAKIAYAAAGAGHLAGQIADIAKRASFKSLNQKGAAKIVWITSLLWAKSSGGIA